MTRLAESWPPSAVAAAIRDVAEFLDVHVDQFAGVLALVTAYVAAGGPVQVRQRGAVVTGQHAVDGGGGQAEMEGDPGRSPAAGGPQLDDPPFSPLRGPGRAGVWPGRPVSHASEPCSR